MHSKHCGVRNTFVDLLSSFQRPTDPFLPHASDYRSLTAVPPADRARYVPPSENPVKSRELRLSSDPELQGSRCLAEPPEPVKKSPSFPVKAANSGAI